MRYLVGVVALALAACGGEAPSETAAATVDAGYWSDGDRSGLCVADGGEAAFILYDDEGEANCMAEGSLEPDGEDGFVFAPRGDDQCRIRIFDDDGSLRFDAADASCTYYCGGDVSLENRSLSRSDATDRALVDPAGDSVC